MNNTKNIFIIIIVVAVVCFLGGYIARPFISPSGTYRAGWQAAEQRLEQSGFGMIIDMEIISIYGEITEINNDKITIEITPLSPLADPELDIRIVTVGENTKIYKLTLKSEEEIQNEEGAEVDPDGIPMPADPYKKEDISLSDLQVGQRISVLAAEDIKDKKEFIAESIQTEAPSPALPGSPELLE